MIENDMRHLSIILYKIKREIEIVKNEKGRRGRINITHKQRRALLPEHENLYKNHENCRLQRIFPRGQ